MKPSFFAALVLGIILGISIAYIDTRPHWNDTGVSVFLILISGFICGFISSRNAWLIAIAVGIWVPLVNILYAYNFGSLLALFPSFIGAFGGSFVRKALPHQSNSKKY